MDRPERLLDSRIAALHQFIAALHQRLAAEPGQAAEVLPEVLEDLQTALEELHVAEEEQYQQNAAVPVQHPPQAEYRKIKRPFPPPAAASS